MTFHITYEARLEPGLTTILVPAGITTPYGCCVSVEVEGAALSDVVASNGLNALQAELSSRDVRIRFHFDEARTSAYDAAMFVPQPSRYTRFADDLVAEVSAVGLGLSDLDRIRSIACHTAERFTYGHPEERFNDGFDAIPALGCGLVEGSCVDINTYFIAALRAAGFEAGYVTGFFFPAEKGDHCEDGHCWVATRAAGIVQEWDIAHHLKIGTRDIHPGLNPKPGFRAACFHSMGVSFPDLGVEDLKALIEPVAVHDGQIIRFDAPTIRLHHPALAAVPA